MRRQRGWTWVLGAAVIAFVVTEIVPLPADAARRRRRRVPRHAVAMLPASDALRDTTLAALAESVERIAAEAGGIAGVAILHLETGERFARHGDDRFPMASVYKLPIALRLLQRVDAGEISLADTVFLLPADLRTGSGRIAARRPRGGPISLIELVEAMMVQSDNTASDYLIRVAGGPGAVTSRIRDLGVRDLRVDRSEIHMAFDYYGVDAPPPETTWTPAVLTALQNGSPYAVRKRTSAEFLQDPRDTTTPNAVVDLLARVWSGEALSVASTTLLLDIMERCATGPGRIPGLLPLGTRIAHKTGTWSSTDGITAAVNDVGIVTLPGGRGHVAIAVLVKGSRRGNGRIERCIARIARVTYDRWVPAAAAQPSADALEVPAGVVASPESAADAVAAPPEPVVPPPAEGPVVPPAAEGPVVPPAAEEPVLPPAADSSTTSPAAPPLPDAPEPLPPPSPDTPPPG